jgi:DNA repair photolyase
MELSKRSSHFVRQFGGPGDDTQIVCFKFWQLVVAGGCPYRCSYCFLQTVPWFRFRPEELYGLLYTNTEDMIAEVQGWLADPLPKMMIVGELQDGLVFDSAYKKVNGTPLTHLLIPLFAAQKRHRLIFLTKSTQIEHALELDSTPQVVFSWSVNAEHVGETWEHGTPLSSERFAATKKMKKAGWPIRFRLDPMVPYDGWKQGYAETIERINFLRPEMVTLGALRASSYRGLRNASRSNGRDDSIFDYLTEEKDASGFKYRIPFEKQVELFRFAVDHLDSRITPALCKEDKALWKALGMRFDGCHCLLGRNDATVSKRT